MSDLHQLLASATDRPVRPVDVDRVVRRGKRRRRTRVALVASLVLVAALGGAWGIGQLRTAIGPEIVDHPNGEQVLDDLGVPVLVGSELYGVPGAPHRLVQPEDEVRMSPDGTAVAYTSIDRAGREHGDTVTPSVRVLDLRTGSDRVIAEGAMTVVWRDARSIATVIGGSFEIGGPDYLGQIAVIDVTTGNREVWTQEPAASYLAASAAGRLIFFREHSRSGGSADQATFVMEGPERFRPIGEPGRNVLVDVSPDGQHALMRWSASQGGTLGQIHLVDLESGDVVARLAPITVDKRIGATGAWQGDTVVMTSDRAGVVELHVTDQSIELLQTIELLPGHDIKEGPGDVAYTNGGIVAVLGQTSFEGPQA